MSSALWRLRRRGRSGHAHCSAGYPPRDAHSCGHGSCRVREYGSRGSPGGAMAQYRVEHDSMGDVRVPVDALWGAQTQRAVENFPISGRPVNERVIRALALVKAEAARVNATLAEVPAVDRPVANAIAAAADEIAAGAHLDQFPIDAYQTGS